MWFTPLPPPPTNCLDELRLRYKLHLRKHYTLAHTHAREGDG